MTIKGTTAPQMKKVPPDAFSCRSPPPDGIPERVNYPGRTLFSPSPTPSRSTRFTRSVFGSRTRGSSPSPGRTWQGRSGAEGRSRSGLVLWGLFQRRRLVFVKRDRRRDLGPREPGVLRRSRPVHPIMTVRAFTVPLLCYKFIKL